MVRKLNDLLKILTIKETVGSMDVEINNICQDSRQVRNGTLFICLTGNHVDGHDYIHEAVTAGASAIMIEREIHESISATVIKVADCRAAMRLLIPLFYDYPGRKLRLIGVTGTNGKTTITYLLQHIFKAAGHATGVIGTIQTVIGDRFLPVKNTTPDVPELQAILAEMVTEEMQFVAMEVSSHALAQHRIAGCEFDCAVFTNLTQDHLDFHGDLTNYKFAKTLLFANLSIESGAKSKKHAIVNIDDPAGQDMIMAAGNSNILSYGIKQTADFSARNINIGAFGMSFILLSPWREIPLNLRITGLFNVYNVLAAIATAFAEGIKSDIVIEALAEFTSVPGRFELVLAGQPFAIIVDYAHTPDGLENILQTACEFSKGRVIVVFGCGGDRDKTKRPIMGKIVAKYADIAIITSDNPRSENPVQIIGDIEIGVCEQLSDMLMHSYQKIPDRRMAILTAIKLAEPDDVLIIAGKGHETYQILADKTIDFDDRQVAREIIGELFNG